MEPSTAGGAVQQGGEARRGRGGGRVRRAGMLKAATCGTVKATLQLADRCSVPHRPLPALPAGLRCATRVPPSLPPSLAPPPPLPSLHCTPSMPRNVSTSSLARRFRLCRSGGRGGGGSEQDSGASTTLARPGSVGAPLQQRCAGSNPSPACGLCARPRSIHALTPTSRIASRSEANSSKEGSPGCRAGRQQAGAGGMMQRKAHMGRAPEHAQASAGVVARPQCTNMCVLTCTYPPTHPPTHPPTPPPAH